jgi:hypothetical protein
MLVVANWTFLTNHARVLLCIAHDPGVRLRDIAVSLGITERSAYGIVTDLAQAGYVVKQKDGRRNRYQIQAHLPLPEPTRRERTVGEVLALPAGTDGRAVTDAHRTRLTPPPARQNATARRQPAGRPAQGAMKIPAAGARMPEPRAALGRPARPGQSATRGSNPFPPDPNPGSVPRPGAEGRGRS